MALSWDYSALAASYDKRPGYSPVALDRLRASTGLRPGDWVADIGAGTGKLTLALLQRGQWVVAVEPNRCMRRRGKKNTAGHQVRWTDATAEATGLPGRRFHLVTFGSSFNVVDRTRALQEAARLLRPQGWLACLWNFRCLEDPLQAQVEALILDRVPGYQYGIRREDQRPVIAGSRLFRRVETIDTGFICNLTVADYVEAWRSHATLARQSGKDFASIIAAIGELLVGKTAIQVPYLTRIWYAQALSRPSQ